MIRSHFDKITETILNNKKNPYYFELQNFDRALSYQLNMAEQKLNIIFPKTRVRRGLINGLGTVIKGISGNLDANDAVHYDQILDDLKNNQQEIVTKLNTEISITTEIIKNFNNTVSFLKQNQEEIKSALSQTVFQLKELNFNFFNYLQARNVLDQINVCLNIILQLLNDIENAINFAKQRILHHSIIKPSELHTITKFVLKHNKPENLLFVEEAEIHKYYNVIDVDAYISGNRIVFILYFPIIYPTKFSHYHLYSIPTKKNTTIIPANSYLTMNEKYFQYTPTPCIDLHPGYYCTQNKLTDGTKHSDCTFQLLQLQDTYKDCQHIPISLSESFIEQVDNSKYIVVAPKEMKILTTCERTDFATLKGTFLVDIPSGCLFETENNRYRNDKHMIKNQPMFLPQIISELKNSTPQYTRIHLHKIRLDKVHELQKQQEQIKPLIPKFQETKSTKYWIIIIYLLIIPLCFYFIVKKLTRLNLCNRRATNRSTSAEDTNSPRTFIIP